MGSSTLSALEFDQNPSRAKRAAAAGPVVIMDRGRPSHVLMTIDDYHKLRGSDLSIVDLLAGDEHDRIAFEAQRASGKLFRPADLEMPERSVTAASRSKSDRGNP